MMRFKKKGGEQLRLPNLLCSGRLSLHEGTTPHYPFSGIAKIAIFREPRKDSRCYLHGTLFIFSNLNLKKLSLCCGRIQICVIACLVSKRCHLTIRGSAHCVVYTRSNLIELQK